jgi:hypothetical protein
MATIGEGLANQFERAWWMLRDVIRKVPEDRWRAGDNPKLTPALWALHVVEAVDAYRQDPAGPCWTPRFGDWEALQAEDLPTQEVIREYLDEVAKGLDELLRGMTGEELLGAAAYDWMGATELERWLYALRHTHSHLGEINMLLRTWGEESGEWR